MSSRKTEGIVWSATSLDDAQGCLRRFFYRKVAGYEEVKVSPARAIGLMVHEAINKGYFLKWDASVAMDIVDQKAAEIKQQWEVSDVDIAKAKAMIIGFYSHYGDPHHPLEPWMKDMKVIGTEMEWETEIVGKPFRGIFDVIGYDEKRKTHILIALKTTSMSDALEKGSTWWRVKGFSTQPIIYEEALRQVEDDVENIEIRYLVIATTKSKPSRKKPIRRKKVETDEEWAQREEENRETIEDFQERMFKYFNEDSRFQDGIVTIGTSDKHIKLMEVKEIACAAEGHLCSVNIPLETRALSWPRNPNECSRFGTCAFFDICTGVEELDTSAKLAKRKKREEQALPF